MSIRSAMLAPALLALSLAAPARGDDSKPIEAGSWKFTTSIGLNLSQSAFSNNWSGGDRGSIAWVLTTASIAERQFTTGFNLKNSLGLAYGQIARQVPDASNRLEWDSPDKSTDVIAFESLARWTLHSIVDPFAAFDLESQFQDQSDPRGMLRFNPIKLRETAGIARLLFKTEQSEGLTRLGFGFRETLAKSFADALGQDQVRYTSTDGGVEWQTDVKQPVIEKKVLYTGSLRVYEPFFYSKSDQLEEVDAALRLADPTRESIADFWKTPDVSFTSAFTAEITKSIGVNLAAQLIYDKFDSAANVDVALATSPDPAVRAAYVAQIDKNVRKAGQFREALILSVTYQIF